MSLCCDPPPDVPNPNDNRYGQHCVATDQLQRSGSVTYNDAGYMISATNAKSETTTFAYDDIGRMEEQLGFVNQHIARRGIPTIK